MRVVLIPAVALSSLVTSTTNAFTQHPPFTLRTISTTTTPTTRYASTSDDDEPSPKSTSLASSLSIPAEIIATQKKSSPIIKAPYVPPQGEAYKHGYFSPTPKLITLDATNTIIQLRSSVGMFYREVLFEATDYNARLPRPELFTQAFKKAFSEKDAESPCFGCGTGTSSKEWWYDVVKRTYSYVPIEQPGLRDEMDDFLLRDVFEALYSDVFVTDEAWELRPGALEALAHFVKWRDAEGGPAVAVMSNFDERLHAILKNLDVYDAFDFVLTSREMGAAKPDRRAFEVAMSRLGLTNAKECVHVGDVFRKDVVGASEAGWHAVFIPENGEQEVPKEGVEEDLVFSMVGDLFGVLHMYGREPEKRVIVSTRHITEEGNFGFHQKTWTDDPSENTGPKTPYALPVVERKSWEGPGRF